MTFLKSFNPKEIFWLCLMLLGALFIPACSDRPYSHELENALKSAGMNRIELDMVLNHYRDDSLKLAAAHYLIANMPYHGSWSGEILNTYRKYYNTFASEGKRGIDSLLQHEKVFSVEDLSYISDIQNIDSHFIIAGIDHAFKMRTVQPWSKNVSFDDFCRYILPYRIDDEPLEDWRHATYDKYESLIDSLPNNALYENPLEAAKIILRQWNEKEFKWSGQLPQGPSLGSTHNNA